MKNISQEYYEKMFDQVQTHSLRGTLDNDISFTDSDVVGVSWTGQCSDKNVKIGSVYISTLKLTFLKDFLNRGEYQDKKITIEDGLHLGEDNIEYVPIGAFYVGEANRTGKNMVVVTAYDCLSKMDKPISNYQTSGYLYDLCKMVETITDAPFGMTREECEALPNGNDLISAFEENDMTTWRDFVSKLAQMVGGFAYADSDGTWKLKSFGTVPVTSIPNIRRMSGSKFSDFQTRFDYLSYVDIKTTGETIYIGNSEGFGMDLGENPFLQFGTPTVIKVRAQRIFDVIKEMKYTPYDVSLLPAFIALDLGDVIAFPDDYTENVSSGALMSITWTYNKSVKIKCFGSNPNLVNAKSAADNRAAANRSSNKDGRVSSFVSTNAEGISIDPDQMREVLRTRFSTSSSQPVLTLTEIKFKTEAPTEVEIFYELDRELIDYIPTETYSEAGYHTISLMYPILGVEQNFPHTFKVLMKSSSGAVIEPLESRTYIQGTGFDVSEQFDGFIEAEDNFYLIPLGALEILTINDSADISMVPAALATASDEINKYNLSAMQLLPIEEGEGVLSPHVFFETIFGYIQTEAGDNLTTESGDRLIL